MEYSTIKRGIVLLRRKGKQENNNHVNTTPVIIIISHITKLADSLNFLQLERDDRKNFVK